MPSNNTPPTPAISPSSLYDSLVVLDTGIDEQIRRFVLLVQEAESLPVSSSKSFIGSLKEIRHAMSAHHRDLQPLTVTEDSCLLLKNAVLEKLLTTRDYMDSILRGLEDCDDHKPHGCGVINTGNIIFQSITLFLTIC